MAKFKIGDYVTGNSNNRYPCTGIKSVCLVSKTERSTDGMMLMEVYSIVRTDERLTGNPEHALRKWDVLEAPFKKMKTIKDQYKTIREVGNE